MRLNYFMSDLTKIAAVDITYNLHASDSAASFQSLSMKPQTNTWTVYTTVCSGFYVQVYKCLASVWSTQVIWNKTFIRSTPLPHIWRIRLDSRLDSRLGFKEAKYVRHNLFLANFCLVEHIVFPKIAKIVTKFFSIKNWSLKYHHQGYCQGTQNETASKF